MEDTQIVKQHYLYMFRLDIIKVEGHTPTPPRLLEYFEKYNITHWIGQEEAGEKTGKLHFQMAIWSEHKIDRKRTVCMRKYWTDRLGSGCCAIASGRKIVSLVSYSSKDNRVEGYGLITNLSQSMLQKIPKWTSKTAEKVLWNEKIDLHIIENDLENANKVKFAVSIMGLHRKNNKRPNRANMQYLMWKYNKLSNVQLLQDWNLLSPYAKDWESDEFTVEDYNEKNDYI